MINKLFHNSLSAPRGPCQCVPCSRDIRIMCHQSPQIPPHLSALCLTSRLTSVCYEHMKNVSSWSGRGCSWPLTLPLMFVAVHTMTWLECMHCLRCKFAWRQNTFLFINFFNLFIYFTRGRCTERGYFCFSFVFVQRGFVVNFWRAVVFVFWKYDK